MNTPAPLPTIDQVPHTKHLKLPRTLILSGVQGSGKGTQGSKLIEQFEFTQLEMGRELRMRADQPAEFNGKPMTIGEIQALGELVPPKYGMPIAAEWMQSLSPEANVLLDGVPRTLEQNDFLVPALKEIDRYHDLMMVLIQFSDDAARRNIAFRAEVDQRADDKKPEIVDKRIDLFHKQTKPIADFYGAEGKLVIVDGETNIDMDGPTRTVRALNELNAIQNPSGRQRAALEGLREVMEHEVKPALQRSIDTVYQRLLQALSK